MQPVLVKLGGSLITDKSKTAQAREKTIWRLAQEIHRARSQTDLAFLLGHGSGGFGHQVAQKYQTHQGIIHQDSTYGMALVQDSAAQLNRIVLRALLENHLAAISVSPSSACMASRSRIDTFYTKPIEALIERGLMPVVYGDIGIDHKLGCCILSTEEILYFLARKLKVKRVIMAGKTNGVFTSDPNKQAGAKPIKTIGPHNFSSIRNQLTDSDEVDVTGGMLLKVTQALDATEFGIQTQIIDGNQDDHLFRALTGDTSLGTLIDSVS